MEPFNKDECIFYKGSVLYALYTENSILVGPDKSEIDNIIRYMSTIEMKQPHLVDQIIGDLKMTNNVKEKTTPAPSSKI